MELELPLLRLIAFACCRLHYSYMELEPYHLSLSLLFELHYIIPIWNWSPNTNKRHNLTNANYIIPIWNWSFINSDSISLITISLHYSYMELEQADLVTMKAFKEELHYSYMELEQHNMMLNAYL